MQLDTRNVKRVEPMQRMEHTAPILPRAEQGRPCFLS